MTVTVRELLTRVPGIAGPPPGRRTAGAMDADVWLWRGGEVCGDSVAAPTDLQHRSLRAARIGVIGDKRGRQRKQMSADQQGADPEQCWNCGGLGSLLIGRMHCPECDVMWMPSSSSRIISVDGLKWGGMPVEFVDFTKPNALSCPA